MTNSRSVGFTLIELILVIIVLGIVSIATTSYLGLGATMYADAAGRDQLLSQSRFAVERITRELRNVVPNSVRTWSEGNGSRQCIEFAPLLQAGRYQGSVATGAVSLFSAADDWNNLVQLATTTPVFMTVYPTNAPTDIYQKERVATTLNMSVNGGDSRVLDVTFSFPATVPDSPSQRMYFMRAPVVYCIENNQLWRYQRTDIVSSQAAANLPTGVLMADDLDNSPVTGFYAANSTLAFSFENSVVLTRNAVVHIRLAFKSGISDSLVFNQEIHIPNVP
ncbi:type II secretion system protein [Rheinheimera sp. 1928-s]|uniref:type II secretion system protein n=1 Tax=Rheinheimera sp. 1928-s TaxID=3033803 RepID=UPI00261F2F23|nr:type II secretion system protein [Rheinheimera sp. 1928-s]MDF3124918.1 type II secretion system protein [Rheinheimera sp. 1928-s]